MISSIHSEPQSSNPEDKDLITLQATVVTHHQNKNTPLLPATSLPILVPSSYIPYKLSPTLIQGKITCHHAQDVSFYKREFHHTPLFTVWIICREIKPLYSQKRFFEHAWQRNIQVRLMEMNKFECLVATNSCSNSDREVDTASSLLYDGEICKEWPQVIIPRMGSKITYFGLALIRFFEGLKENKPFILNESKGIEIAKDKFITMQKLASQHISIPKTMLLIHPLNIEQVHQHFEYPLVLKKVSGSQGKGVMLIHDRSQLVDLAEMVDPNSQMLLQEFIKSSKGVDIRVLVLGEKVLGAIKRIAKEGFKANFHQGGNVEPFALTPCIENLAVSAVKACGLLFAGVDILMGESSNDSYRVCEVNSSPGFEGFELATGIDVAREVMSFCETNVFH
ncbi:hypothetical protein C9374_006671 [Naegleria lovaniensis]|uniref:N-acetylaspartylglutamate synthase n=1 Tax=Naegleria lovaniensis TaxID=51637 RepID=A0AA88GHK5_NAELO|nr:uncharacterized protein C9374_006671 [Naegleria lovaniensis]KAG2379554.1 hypothetical protein C9374_006671 [Naegleria lovaniensis]